MNVDETKNILLAHALESSDTQTVLLTAEDRIAASRGAGAPLDRQAEVKQQDQFLALRASFLLARLSDRLPLLGHWISGEQHTRERRFALATWLLMVAAVLVGYFSNALDPESRINILSFPLLTIIVWSLIVYVKEIAVISQKKRPRPLDGFWHPLIKWLFPEERLEGAATDEAAPILHEAKRSFHRHWLALTGPVWLARVRTRLHVLAAVVAISAVAGMYVKGLANEYLAVWESTFFTEGAQLRPLLRVILGPAAAVSGSSLPDAAQLDAIRWHAAEGGTRVGENASRWIHWYALTIVIYVLVPRLLLASYWHWRSRYWINHLPYREVAPDYFEHLLSTSTGSSVTIRAVPYLVDITPELNARIQRVLEDQYERPVDLAWNDVIPFGSEEDSELYQVEQGESVMPVFNFSSTPEVETHLVVYQTLSAASPHPVKLILLDTSSFDRKTANLAEASDMRETRLATWRRLFTEQTEGGRVELLPLPLA